jgi:ribonuclease VapC
VVLDTSAVIAILFAEPESRDFISRLSDAIDPVISAATLVEASIVVHARTGKGGLRDLDDLLTSAGVRCIAVDAVQAELARAAFIAYGKGHSPAGLNYGDCFSYALAAALGEPLLFKGEDFAKTDIEPAAA